MSKSTEAGERSRGEESCHKVHHLLQVFRTSGERVLQYQKQGDGTSRVIKDREP